MNNNIKISLGSIIVIISITLGLLVYGLILMDEEDRYGNLVYFKEKVKDGDIIIRVSSKIKSNSTSEFNEYGIIEKSLSEVYVWDNQNTLKQNLYDWAEKSKNRNVKVYRLRNSNFDINENLILSNDYSEFLNTSNFEFIVEN